MRRKSTDTKRTKTKPTNEEIFKLVKERAYNIYCQRGDYPGDELGDWLIAESQVRQEIQKTPVARRATQSRTSTGGTYSDRIPRRAARR